MPDELKQTKGKAKEYQEIMTPLTPPMIFVALVEKYPHLFSKDSELVKFEGGSKPKVRTRREVMAS